MALYSALLKSTASAFHSQLSVRLPSVTFTAARSFSSSSVVLMEKTEADLVDRLKDTYIEKIVPALIEEFNYANIDQVPKVKRIVVNYGTGDTAKDVDAAMSDLELITGQKPFKMRAKNANPTFKTRGAKGDQSVGISCTLRGNVMYSFLARLINLGLSRMRDFQGVSYSRFDGNGNYSIGFREQSVFPELSFDILGKPRGMDVRITTTANTNEETHRLLALMGMPFREGAGPGTTRMRKKKA